MTVAFINGVAAASVAAVNAIAAASIAAVDGIPFDGGGAAAPVVESRNAVRSTTFTTSHSVTMPSGISAGDLILVVFSNNSTGTTQSIDTGVSGVNWSTLATVADTSNIRTVVYAKIAAGGDALTITTSASAWTSRTAYRISGCDSVAKVYTQTQAIQVNAAPDPSSFAPSFGSAAYLWIACAQWLGAASPISLSGYPSTYVGTQTSSAPDATNKCGSGSAETTTTAASENPGAFTLSASTNNRCQVIAVRG